VNQATIGREILQIGRNNARHVVFQRTTGIGIIIAHPASDGTMMAWTTRMLVTRKEANLEIVIVATAVEKGRTTTTTGMADGTAMTIIEVIGIADTAMTDTDLMRGLIGGMTTTMTLTDLVGDGITTMIGMSHTEEVVTATVASKEKDTMTVSAISRMVVCGVDIMRIIAAPDHHYFVLPGKLDPDRPSHGLMHRSEIQGEPPLSNSLT
jgi:hypothetical protein